MQRHSIIIVSLLLVAFGAHAEESRIAPLPVAITEEQDQSRITPPGGDDSRILSTKPEPSEPRIDRPAPPIAPLPEKPATATATPAPAPTAAPAAAPAAMPFGMGSAMPFGKATSRGPEIPSGPHTAVATPVLGVDAVEVSDPAPPTPVAPEADPAAQDPAEPTELTSPIFGEKDDIAGPRKIVLRALNKVTTQSTLFKTSPGDTVKFGRLEITTVTCRESLPNSQTDYAGLLDIVENLADKSGTKKQLFKGWMYASSPSISSLEHPIYDITMVSCESATPPKPAPKADKKSEKKNKK